ncbi:MAG: VOC family protein [Myxococcales bacterium]|nr:VOC family protein [Myxococcales bacterium]MCB9641839.1 VOC family protein [Myxococcales bacterium]
MLQPHYKPKGFNTITAYLRIKGASEAIEFYKKVFDAQEIMRLSNPDGTLGHAQIQIDDTIVMLADEYPEMNIVGPQSLGGTSVAMAFYTEDADKVFAKALAAGAQEVFPLKDQFYGERAGRIRDPFGHEWMIATVKEEVSTEEMQRRYVEMMRQGE